MTSSGDFTSVRHVARGRVPMFGRADASAPLSSELIHGETFTVLGGSGDWLLGRNEFDSYEGWVPAAALAPGAAPDPTHVVADPRVFVYPTPSMKNPVLDELPLASRVAIVETRDAWSRLAAGGWVYSRHLAPLDRFELDIVATAERLIGVPYMWGGRTPHGIDCSGLSQLALSRAGLVIPRDSGPQRESVGIEVRDGEIRRGDLLCYPGHVAIARDATTVVHATAHSMTVTIEAAADVAARAGSAPTIRRPALAR